MTSFYDSYDYWNLSEDWFVAGYALDGKTAAQFRPTRTKIIKSIERVYRDSKTSNTQQLLESELAWHKQPEEVLTQEHRHKLDALVGELEEQFTNYINKLRVKQGEFV